jgi:hypothetical protein
LPGFAIGSQAVSNQVLAWLLVGASVAIYADTIDYGYVDYDDNTILLAHPSLYNEHSFSSSLEQIFAGYFPREEPLLIRDVTWAIESRLFGHVAAWPRHLGNVLLNAANVGLAFAFILAITGQRALAFGVAMAWSVLAVRTEAVAWVMGRKDVLSAFFALAALNIEARRWNGRARALAYAAALALVGAAILSKVSALTLFAVLIVVRAPSLEFRPIATAVLRYTPHAALSIGIYIWYAGIIRDFGVTGRSPGWSLEYLGVLLDFLPLVAFEYARHLALPFDLSIAYQIPSINIALTDGQIVTSRLMLLAMVATTVVLLRWRRDVLYLWLAFALAMATYLNFVYIGIWIADRYLYFSSLFLIALLAKLAAPVMGGASRGARTALLSLSGGVLALNLAQVLMHQRAWVDNLALWTHEVALERPTLLAYQALARELLRRANAPGVADVDRRTILERVESTLDAGFMTAEQLNIRQSPYYTTETHYHSKLLHYRGRLLEARGAPLTDQVAAFQSAYDLKPRDRLNTMTLAEKHFQLATMTSSSSGHAELSLKYFDEYVGLSLQDPATHAQIVHMLEANYTRFVNLAPAVAEMRRRYFGDPIP